MIRTCKWVVAKELPRSTAKWRILRALLRPIEDAKSINAKPVDEPAGGSARELRAGIAGEELVKDSSPLRRVPRG